MSKKENDALLAISAQLPKADRIFLLRLACILQEGEFRDVDAEFLLRLSATFAAKRPRGKRPHLRVVAGGAA